MAASRGVTFRRAALAAACLASAASLAPASEKLTAEMRTVPMRPRTASPVLVEVVFGREGARLLEGHLQVHLSTGAATFARVRSPDIALTSGEQTVSFTLPPLPSGYNEEILAGLEFVTARGAWNLGTAKLPAAPPTSRWFAVSVYAPGGERDAAVRRLCSELRMESRVAGADKLSNQALWTSFAYQDPRDAPAHPMGYLGSDLVVLAGEGLSSLTRRQMDAVERWVAAGGSLLAVPGAGLSPQHVAFLSELARSPGREWAPDAAGRLVSSDGGPDGVSIRNARRHLGRVSVAVRPPSSPEDYESNEWRRAWEHLWKVRARPDWSGIRKGMAEPNGSSETSAGVVPLQTGGWLFENLLPRSVQPVPLWLIMGVLILFVVAIGPLEYILLGKLKARRLTWFTFPLTSVAFAVFMVLAADYYLGTQDHRRALVIVDVSRDGRVLRRSRYEVVLSAGNARAAHDLAGAAFTPMDISEFSREDYGYQYRYYRTTGGVGQSGAVAYAGAFPYAYRAVQDLRQWAPQMNRTFSIPSADERDDLDWSRVSPGDPVDRTARALAGGTDFAGTVSRVNANGTFGGVRSGPRGAKHEILAAASSRPKQGLFAVVSQVSPSGGPNFEDMSLLDSEPGDTAVLAVEKSGDDVVVRRCVYWGGE